MLLQLYPQLYGMFKFFYRSPTAIPWPTPHTSSFHGHPPPPAAIITNNQLQRNTYSQAQGTAMVSRVLPGAKYLGFFSSRSLKNDKIEK